MTTVTESILRRPVARRVLRIWRLGGAARFVNRELKYELAGLTMVEPRRLWPLVDHVDTILREDIPGAVIECGTWRGGASFLMARRLAGRRTVWMFDSFEGLPPPDPFDASEEVLAAATRLNNCRADVERVRADARRLGLAGHVRIVKGWFAETLPRHRDEIGPIALLRIDADLYRSVTSCLEQLMPQVSQGGFVVFDDYFSWSGCTLAVHDYLSAQRLPYPLLLGAGCEYHVRVPRVQAAHGVGGSRPESSTLPPPS